MPTALRGLLRCCLDHSRSNVEAARGPVECRPAISSADQDDANLIALTAFESTIKPPTR